MNQKAIDLAANLGYQTAAGVHTYGPCSLDGCKRIARGSAHCPACIEVELAKEVGAETAAQLHALYTKRMHIQDDINNLIGDFE